MVSWVTKQIFKSVKKFKLMAFYLITIEQNYSITASEITEHTQIHGDETTQYWTMNGSLQKSRRDF